jgi:NAD(P)-dependent dehydrogenase (short-subunit alcohol dehydrogenase family)
LVALCVERYGRIDGVVGCAGVVRERTLLHLSDDDLDAYLSTHVGAAFELTRSAARAMIDGGRGGAIVHATGAQAFFGSAQKAASGAASAAVVGLTRSAAVELRKHGVRVNAIVPTAHTRATADLPMFKGVREGSMSPEHIAPVVAHLLSDAAADVFGEVVGIAGGRLYALRARETTGIFSQGRPLTAEEIVNGWTDAMRGPSSSSR